MVRKNWDTTAIGDQNGKIVLITGASSGLGKEAARVLAGKNAEVILAVRNIEKGEGAAGEIKKEFPEAKLSMMQLDLSSLDSVRIFTSEIKNKYSRLDILINNAGIMMCPYSKTRDGFEIQMGTNHLGHFALTGLLLPLIRKTKGSRIVATSSMAHRMGNIDFDDINWERRKYNTQKAYGDSKLANLLFMYELKDKLSSDNHAPLVTAAHPGWTRTELQRHSGFFSFMNNFFSQDVRMGTLPTLRAAVDPNANSGDYYGPAGLLEMQGSPVRVNSNKRSHDKQAALRLWELSEKLTGVSY